MRKAVFPNLVIFILTFMFCSISYSQDKVEVKKYVVVVSDVNVRVMPSVNGEVIFVAKSGERMEILEDMGKWLKVKSKNGIVGYVSSKYVRVEVVKTIIKSESIKETKKIKEPEKIKKTGEIKKPEVEKKKQNVEKTESGKKESKIEKPFEEKPQKIVKELTKKEVNKKMEVSFDFSYGFVDPSEFNATFSFYNALFEYLYDVNKSGGYETELSPLLSGIKDMPGGSFELRYYLNPSIGVNIGMEFYSSGVKENLFLNIDYGYDEVEYTVSNDINSKIYAPYIGLTFSIPSKTLSLDIYGDIGYFMGNFKKESNFIIYLNGKEDYGYTETIPELKKSSIGFMGGVRAKLSLSENMGFFVNAKYKVVKFKELEGTQEIDYINGSSKTYEGTLWYLEYYMLGEWNNISFIYETEPEGTNYKNARPAEFDFSGIYLSAGLFFRF